MTITIPDQEGGAIIVICLLSSYLERKNHGAVVQNN